MSDTEVSGVATPRLLMLLRGLAVVIVIAAIMDPQIATTRRVKPVVAVVGTGSDTRVEKQLGDALRRDNVVVSGSVSGVDATVLVDAAAAPFVSAAAPVVAMELPRETRLLNVDYPQEALVGTVATVALSVEVVGDADSLFLELRDGDALVDSRRIAVDKSTAIQRETLSLVLPTPGLRVLSVSANTSAEVQGRDQKLLAIDVTNSSYRVHFHDMRTSWLSTFVRRNAELDPRFNVSRRTATSRGISTVSGDAARSLSDLSALEGVELVVVGAPEQLSRGELNALDSFLRERGGSVLLLFDRPVAGLTAALTGVGRWRSGSARSPFDVSLAGTASGTWDSTVSNDADKAVPPFRASEWMAPVMLPPGAQVVAGVAGADSLPLLFTMAVGAGRLYVSSALDSWRYRDPDVSGFLQSWNEVLADAASVALPQLEVSVAASASWPSTPLNTAANPTRLLEPSAPYTVNVVGRGALAGPSALAVSEPVSVGARLLAAENGLEVERIRLYPTSLPAGFTGGFVAPREPGVYDLEVRFAAKGDTFADTQKVVVAVPGSALRSVPAPAAGPWGGKSQQRSTLEVLTIAAGGVLLESPEEVQGALHRLVRPPEARIQWYPMRSSWWILPLTVLLGAEWWLRRRRGLP